MSSCKNFYWVFLKNPSNNIDIVTLNINSMRKKYLLPSTIMEYSTWYLQVSKCWNRIISAGRFHDLRMRWKSARKKNLNGSHCTFSAGLLELNKTGIASSLITLIRLTNSCEKLVPHNKGTPSFLDSLKHSSSSFTSRDIGFSHITAFPALKHAKIKSRC